MTECDCECLLPLCAVFDLKLTGSESTCQSSVNDTEVTDCFANISDRLKAQHLVKTKTGSPEWWLVQLKTQIHVSYVIVRAENGERVFGRIFTREICLNAQLKFCFPAEQAAAAD